MIITAEPSTELDLSYAKLVECWLKLVTIIGCLNIVFFTIIDPAEDDDDEDYEEPGRGNHFLGFMFGNVDDSGDLDADYLDEVMSFRISFSLKGQSLHFVVLVLFFSCSSF